MNKIKGNIIVFFSLISLFLSVCIAYTCPSYYSGSKTVSTGSCINGERIITTKYCVKACCNPPSSYWGCPASYGGACDNGSLGFCTCSSQPQSTSSQNCAIDIGLRIYDGTETITVAVEPQGILSGPLRIGKGGVVYSIVLVDASHSKASNIRVQTSAGIKAIRKY